MSKKKMLVSNKTLVKFAVVSVLLTSIVFLVQSISENEDLLSDFVLVYYTNFEDAEKVDDRHLSFPVGHYFNFDGRLENNTWVRGGEGARFWVENSIAHSGSRCIGMELFNITKSLRNEFVIYDVHEQLGDEIFVSAWFYLPADWMLYGPDGLRWYSLMVFFREYDNNYLPYMCLHISQPKIDVPEFDVYVFWRKIDNSKEVISHVSNFSLPRGRWFPVQYYLKRDPTAGILKVWMDGKLICDKSAIETKVQNEYYISIAKIYHEPYDNVPHQLWVDDIELRKRSES